jgi:hypothetical protein
LPTSPRIPFRFQERHHSFELVVDGSRRLFLLVSKKSGELEQVITLDLMQVELAAGLGEIVQGCCVGGKGHEFVYFLSTPAVVSLAIRLMLGQIASHRASHHPKCLYMFII